MDLPASETVPGGHRVGITRIHLEEDVARLTHVGTGPGGYTLMDINRAGVPLMETVSEPDIRPPQQAEAYILELQSTMRYRGTSPANLQEVGSRRDATFAPRCLVGSGFPIPVKGSRVTASTKSMTLSATRRLVSIQKRRSSLNSSCK